MASSAAIIFGTDEVAKALTPDIDIPQDPRAPDSADPATQADAAVAQQRRRNAAGVSRSDTILTSPLGTPNNAPITRKTLLGE